MLAFSNLFLVLGGSLALSMDKREEAKARPQEQPSEIKFESIERIGGEIREPFVKVSVESFDLSGNASRKNITVEPFFLKTGQRVERTRVAMCSNCKGYVLDSNPNAIYYQGSVFCMQCFQMIYSLSKDEYKLLLCIVSGIEKPKDISRIAGIRKEWVKAILDSLILKGYIIKDSFLGLFKHLRLSSGGEEALGIYEKQVFGKDKDSLAVKARIISYLKSRASR